MGSTIMSNAVDFSDVQGLVRFGYKRMTKARYDLLRIRNPDAARQWLQSAPVNSAKAMNPPPKSALHVAFTAGGLKALGTPHSIVEAFSLEFRSGMAAEFRTRQLGDVGRNSPENWDWGNPVQELHLLVIMLGEPEIFDAFIRETTSGQFAEAFETVRSLGTADMDGIEPFGFVDGISQPKIDWKQERSTEYPKFEYENMAALGEFLLGYRNEYGKITTRPLLRPGPDNSGLPDAIDHPGMKDLGRNGTYLVMRQLEQDVRTFWQFMNEQSGGDQNEAENLAASMVGRKRDGTPLVSVHENQESFAESPLNTFTYNDDPAGTRCPFGAHVRRTNPRNADYPRRPSSLFKKLLIALGFGTPDFRDDLMSSVRFHRILRRGREYGSELKPEDALGPAPENDEPRGLHFICLNADISRQFEFSQNAWIASSKFSAMTGESDPLLGNRMPTPGCPVTDAFNIPREEGLRNQVSALPQFVTVRGGAYFFMPGLSALRHIANL